MLHSKAHRGGDEEPTTHAYQNIDTSPHIETKEVILCFSIVFL
jgi:hypothetical protein